MCILSAMHRVLDVKTVKQCKVLHDLGVFLVLADKVRKFCCAWVWGVRQQADGCYSHCLLIVLMFWFSYLRQRQRLNLNPTPRKSA